MASLVTQPPEETGSTFPSRTSAAQARSAPRDYRVLPEGPFCGASAAAIAEILGAVIELGAYRDPAIATSRYCRLTAGDEVADEP